MLIISLYRVIFKQRVMPVVLLNIYIYIYIKTQKSRGGQFKIRLLLRAARYLVLVRDTPLTALTALTTKRRR